jgi:hypothetical protein
LGSERGLQWNLGFSTEIYVDQKPICVFLMAEEHILENGLGYAQTDAHLENNDAKCENILIKLFFGFVYN